MFRKEDVRFPAEGGIELSAWLFVPEHQAARLPAVTMAHGYAGTKYHGIEPMAAAFAEAGFVVLLHDHRGFGESGGDPRQDINPWQQIADWRRAISYLQDRPEVDENRVGLWGTSFAGGHAIVLGATDRRLVQWHGMSTWKGSAMKRKSMLAIAIASAVVVLGSTAISAQDAGAFAQSSVVNVENEPAPSLTVQPPLPGPLAQGVVFIPYRLENLRIVPVGGAAARDISPRVGHLHITLDDLPWQWADYGGSNTVILVGLPRGEHKVRIEAVDPEGRPFTARTVTFTVPGPVSASR